MTEFALALPLLVVVLALLWLVGWMHMRKQRVIVASRHVVWRQVVGDRLSDQDVDDQLLGRVPISVEQTGYRGHWSDISDWVDAVAQVDDQAGVLADETIMDRWVPREDIFIVLEAEYNPPLAIGRGFADDMSFRHGRPDAEWVRGEVSQREALRELYYEDLDAALRSVGGAGQPMAEYVRGLYLWSW